MAILGSIRKRPIFLVMIIGLALFAFVLSGMFGNDSGISRNNVGSVNGEEISVNQFSRVLDRYKGQNSNSSLQSVNSAWDAIVREKVYEKQINKSGIVVGEKDVWDQLISYPQIQNNPAYKNEAGLFDEDKYRSEIATIKSTKQGKANWINQEKGIIKFLQTSTYDNLVKAGLTASLKEGKQFYTSQNTSANIQFVYEPYTTIKAEEVKVTDAEVTAYVKSHADEFKAEATREIEFVNFELKPSKIDFEEAKKAILKIKKEFTATTDVKLFVNDYSDSNYIDKLYFAKDLDLGIYDSITKLAIGSVYGPYINKDTYKLIKYLGKKSEKSVKSSHILISYKGSASNNTNLTRTKEEAEKFANNLLEKVNKTNFGLLAQTNSDDLGSKNNSGAYGWKKQGEFVTEYNDFMFNNRIGKIGIVETVFGYHIIKVDDIKKDSGLDLAIISSKVVPTSITESEIYEKAETFAANLTKGDDILELAKTNNYAIKKANNLTELSENIIGLGNQRDIVKWTFNNGTKKNEVKRFDLENSFVIVRLKSKNEKGLTSLAVAKPKVVPILEKIKKTKIIKAKITGSTLDEIAKSLGKSINSANDISISNSNLKVGGNDPNIAAALLYINEGDVKIINGKSGIYAIKVVKKIPLQDIKNYTTYSKTITTQLKTKTNLIYNALKENANVDDKRATIY